MCKFNIIENAQEFSAILLLCDEAVKEAQSVSFEIFYGNQII
jgi:hypothetical protein